MLIEQDALKNWTRGSFEHVRLETARALQEARKNREIDFGFRLLATYESHAIIVSPEGAFYRCHLKETKDFGRKVLRVEKIKGPPVVAEADEPGYIVDSLLEGGLSSDLIASLAEKDNGSAASEAIVGQLQSMIDGRTLWGSYYEQNEPEIERANWRSATCRAEDAAKNMKCYPDGWRRRFAFVRERAESGLRGEGSAICKMVREGAGEFEYWLSKLQDSSLPPTYGSTQQGLLECQHKLDMLIVYAESLRGRI